MKIKALLLILMIGLCSSGCANFSPRQAPRIENQNGRIGEVETLANSLKAEVGKLQTQSEIQNSKLDKIQQGLANFQQNNENHGVQILSGSGGLVLAAGLAVIGLVGLLYYRSESKKNEKTADILAERIVSQNNNTLLDSVFQAAMYTNVEDKVLGLVKKHLYTH